MLEPWIIEELLKREREREEQNRPVLRIEIEPPPLVEIVREEQPEERGVFIIDLLG